MVAKMLEGTDVITGVDFNQDQDKWRSKARKVLYTGALDEFFGYSLGHLEYRSVRFEDERIETDNWQGVAVVNYTSADVPYTRIIEHKHFEWVDSPVTWISREYPEEFGKSGEPYYPINNERNNELYRKYRDLADQCEWLLLGGRLAQYAYFDMDKTIRAALDLAGKCNG